jgi:lysozyme
MKLPQCGIDLIKQFEGCTLKAYPDPASGGEPWTIGWGSTGPDIHPDTIWTQQQADDTLLTDLQKVLDSMVSLIHIDLDENQYGALLSFTYNLGLGSLESSTLLRLINAGALTNAAKEFPKWDRAAGKEMQGLLKRRLAEQKLFSKGV